jgi:hypothetical protein
MKQLLVFWLQRSKHAPRSDDEQLKVWQTMLRRTALAIEREFFSDAGSLAEYEATDTLKQRARRLHPRVLTCLRTLRPSPMTQMIRECFGNVDT